MKKQNSYLIMEGSANPKNLKESVLTEDITHEVILPLLPLLSVIAGVGIGSFIGDLDLDRGIIQSLKDSWNGYFRNRAVKKIVDRIKDDKDVQEFLNHPSKPGWTKMLVTKLTSEEKKYLYSLTRNKF